MPIRIHLIRTHYAHWSGYSGIHRFIRYMDPDRFRIEVRAVSDSDDDFPLRNRMIRGALGSVIRGRGMKWYKLSDLAAEFGVVRGALSRRWDVVHFLDGEHSAQFSPAILRRLPTHPPRIIATYHQPPEVLDRLVIKKVVALLDEVTVVSPTQVDFFRGLIPREKIRLILHGIDVEFFRPSGRSKESGKLNCITVGHYLRDYDAFILTAKRLAEVPQIEFHVVSSSPPPGLSGLPNVRVHSRIGDAELLSLYQKAHVLFLPLIQSTANNSLLEGLACGLPVVSTKLASVEAYVPGREAILISKNDPDELADALLHLWRHPEECADRGRDSRQRAEALQWRNIAPQYAELYSGNQ